jgi:hypothetical protein
VTEVVEVDLARAELAGSNLELPATGPEGAYYLEVQGWALGDRVRVEAVVVTSARGEHLRLPVDGARPDIAETFPDSPAAGESGFRGILNGLDLGRDFELPIVLELADGRRVPAWTVRGRRDRLLPEGDRPAFRPVIQRGHGRTGSTYLSHLLAQHPELLCYRPFVHEPRIAAYWLEVLWNLGRPTSYLSALSPELHRELWWLGGGRDAAPTTIDMVELRDDAVRAGLGGEAVRRLAAFARDRIDDFYARVARAEGKDGANVFAEKTLERRGHEPLRALMDDLYPDFREVLLVRDPRDMLCSMLAYDEKRGYAGWGRRPEQDVDDFVVQLHEDLLRMMETHRAKGSGSLLVRYEDLVLDPAATLARVLEHVEVDAGTRTIADVLAGAREEVEGMAFHRTTASAADSIDRWRRDLDPERAERVSAVFADTLGALGYS